MFVCLCVMQLASWLLQRYAHALTELIREIFLAERARLIFVVVVDQRQNVAARIP